MAKMEIDNQIFSRATEWLAHLHADGEPDWHDPQLSEWLEQSEDHRLAFAEASGYWFAAGEVSLELEEDHAVSYSPQPGQGRRLRFWSGSLFALLMIMWFAAPLGSSLIQQARFDFHAPDGQVKRQTMADGSVISLGGETNIDIEFTTDRRLVTLYEGEAFFDVAADPKRPFIVQFAAGDVLVLGTHFGIISNPEESLVGVVSGRVDAGPGGSGQRLILGGNELVTITDSGMKKDSRRPEEVFAWTGGQLVFKQQSLTRILERMDHYLEGRIILLRTPGDDRRFSLVVSLSNASRALDTLVEQAGLRRTTIAGMTLLY
jgi:transmembrane sensor